MMSDVSAEELMAPSTNWMCVLLTMGMVSCGLNDVNVFVKVCSKIVVSIALEKRAPEPHPNGVWTGVIFGTGAFTAIGFVSGATATVFAGGGVG